MSRPLGVPEVRRERMFPDEVEAAFEPLAPEVRLLTYAEIESLWSEVVAPQFPTFACMQDGDSTVPPDSRWHANWRVPKPSPSDLRPKA